MGKKTKRANTKQALRRRNAIRGAAWSTAMQILAAFMLFWLRAGAGEFVSRLLLIGAVFSLIMIPPVWFALRERLREIKGGEEEDASQY